MIRGINIGAKLYKECHKCDVIMVNLICIPLKVQFGTGNECTGIEHCATLAVQTHNDPWNAKWQKRKLVLYVHYCTLALQNSFFTHFL